MPLNSHSYLVAQGWQGTGTALRDGAVARPVIIAQKKTLAGVGKDRDEAFPFWDHLFTAAAASIKVKLYNDDGDEDSDTPQPSGSGTPLDRTSTGIISNKPQKVGLSALTTLAASRVTGLSVMALAKRESARRGLYSRFFRGPVLGPDTEEPPVLEVTSRSSPSRSKSNGPKRSVTITENEKKRKSREEVKEETGVARKKRKSKRENETKEERRKRRRLRALKGEAKEIPELRLDGEVEAGLTKVPTAPESSDYSRGRDREKKRKLKVRESTVCNDD